MNVDPIVAALTRRRLALEWTQEQLATVLNVNPATVAGWEQGWHVPDLECIHRWAAALGMVVRAIEAADLLAEVPDVA